MGLVNVKMLCPFCLLASLPSPIKQSQAPSILFCLYDQDSQFEVSIEPMLGKVVSGVLDLRITIVNTAEVVITYGVILTGSDATHCK